jgi:hypothetical protein
VVICLTCIVGVYLLIRRSLKQMTCNKRCEVFALVDLAASCTTVSSSVATSRSASVCMKELESS